MAVNFIGNGALFCRSSPNRGASKTGSGTYQSCVLHVINDDESSTARLFVWHPLLVLIPEHATQCVALMETIRHICCTSRARWEDNDVEPA